jgi:hypothetical protein
MYCRQKSHDEPLRKYTRNCLVCRIWNGWDASARFHRIWEMKFDAWLFLVYFCIAATISFEHIHTHIDCGSSRLLKWYRLSATTSPFGRNTAFCLVCRIWNGWDASARFHRIWEMKFDAWLFHTHIDCGSSRLLKWYRLSATTSPFDLFSISPPLSSLKELQLYCKGGEIEKRSNGLVVADSRYHFNNRLVEPRGGVSAVSNPAD